MCRSTAKWSSQQKARYRPSSWRAAHWLRHHRERGGYADTRSATSATDLRAASSSEPADAVELEVSGSLAGASSYGEPSPSTAVWALMSRASASVGLARSRAHDASRAPA